MTGGKCFICSAVQTPSLQEFNVAEGTSVENSNGDESGNTFIDWWVVEHASQVNGVLPGGLDVVGVFICCESLPHLMTKLAGVLRTIATKLESKGHHPHSHMSLLHFCPMKKKFKCQTINSSDPQAGFVPAEFKFKTHVNQWLKIEAVISVDTECYVPSDKKEKGEESKATKLSHTQAREGIEEFLECVESSVVTLNGQVVQDATSPVKTGKKSQEVIQAALHLKSPQATSAPPRLLPTARKVSLKGSMSVLSYVHPKATCAEAIAAVKQDACRSLVSRVQAMVESAAQSHQVLDQLPMRVALSSPTNKWGIPFTEYSLPHEDMQECMSRASDLLVTDMESISATPLEQFPEEAEEKEEAPDEYKSVLTLYSGFASILAAVVVILVAISLWIMLQ